MEQKLWCVGTKFIARESSVEATQDLLPGDVVFVQNEPIMFLSNQDVYNRHHDERLSLLFAAYETFTSKFSESEQAAFLALRSSQNATADLRKIATAVVVNRRDNKFTRMLNKFEIDKFVKVASIVRMNLFVVSDGYVVFDSQPLTRMSHSCIPNCSVEIINHVCTCRIIRSVSAGETLSYEYSSRTRLLPTHLRRQYYFEKNSFTCHCPRCTSTFDDTRQFKCFDSNCYGSHLVCQPLNQNEMLCPQIGSYTRVDYVPPHLLPCTVCHRFPPTLFQVDMLTHESWLPSAVAEITALGHQVLVEKDYGLAPTVLLKIARAISFNPHHVMSFEPLRVGYQMWMVHVFLYGDAYLPKFYRAVDNFVMAFHQHTQFPSDQGVTVLVALVRDLMHIPTKLSVMKAHAACAQALRMHCVLHGRDSYHRGDLDRLLTGILEKMASSSDTLPLIQLSPTGQDNTPSDTASNTSTAFSSSSHSTPAPRGTPPTLVCAYCGECAALALCKNKRCTTCKDTSYCSISCQKAHYRVHKALCSAPVP